MPERGIRPDQDHLQPLKALEVSGKGLWSECRHEHSVFARIMVGLVAKSIERTIMIDASCLRAHRTACSLRPKKEARAPERSNERVRGKKTLSGGQFRPRTDHQAARRHRCERQAYPPFPVGRAGQRLYRRGGASGQPAAADWFLADRGYDADWLRKAFGGSGIQACIPGRKSCRKPVTYDKRRCKRRNRIAIMFGRLKDWRRVATRVDRCAQTDLSAIYPSGST